MGTPNMGSDSRLTDVRPRAVRQLNSMALVSASEPATMSAIGAKGKP